ncbi:MAG TPA: hypothetical protein VNX68_04300 [Nitrosopumilaceae archaeon]|jgi:hypothetical protein|nr:hypothetical protein [Nitrosopumilaceae archaeon]
MKTIRQTITELIKAFEERNDQHCRSCDSSLERGNDWEIEQLLKVIQSLLR